MEKEPLGKHQLIPEGVPMLNKDVRAGQQIGDAIVSLLIEQGRDVRFLIDDLVPDDEILRTREHSKGTSVFAFGICMQMAKKGQLARNRIPGILLGARLHDVGKNDQTLRLLKRSDLNDAQKQELKGHVAQGLFALWGFQEIIPQIGKLLGFDDIVNQAAWIAFNHHERMDGSGPHGLKGEALPLGARIVAVAEKFDSLVNGQKVIEKGNVKYRTQPMELNEAFEKMKNQPEKWDSKVLVALREVVKTSTQSQILQS